MNALSAHVALARGDLILDVEVNVAAGETVALLGPNAAGKSTLVEALCGLIPIDAGEVRVGGDLWESRNERVRLHPQQRSVGVMFQSLLLFPALSAVDNVAYGLRASHMSKVAARATALRVMERFDIADVAEQMPSTLSGGQAQRVALARALAVEPDVLLLDEPMSSLDIENRAEARRALGDALDGFAGATLLVTHEPLEAMALADRLVIIERGRIVQTGTMGDIRRHPRSRYVASLVGVNLLTGRIVRRSDHVVLDTGEGELVITHEGPRSARALATVHPRAIALSTRPLAGGSSIRNVVRSRVAALDVEADRVRVELHGRPPLTAEITIEAHAELALEVGQEVWAAVKATQIDVHPA
ncbi:MAG: sulfate/molybdate ABC transporter ATP-binding protein [Actinomycetota bacterium]